MCHVTRALQVVLEKHQASKALGPGCLSVLHMFAPRNIGLASAGSLQFDVMCGALYMAWCVWRVMNALDQHLRCRSVRSIHY